MTELIKHSKSIAEFGGKSPLFNDIYKLFKNIDGYNLFENNYWQKEFKETYLGEGKQYNCDIVGLTKGSYDLILNSHVIEHIANPIQALMNWHQILRPNGMILSVIPDKSQMFDCNRPLTTLEHLIADYMDGTQENDTTHIDEAINLFINNGGYDYDNYVMSSNNNYLYRAIHHHCFDFNLVRNMFIWSGYEVVKQEQYGMHIWTLSKLI